jgi:hypothetical protein
MAWLRPRESLVLIWLRRLAASATDSFIALVAIFVAVLPPILKSSGVDVGASTTPIYWILVPAAVVFALQTSFGFVRRTHEPTWALKYQQMWDSDDGYVRRITASQTIKELRHRLAELEDNRLVNIDDALDLLEDIAFYVFGGQISPESAHHHFFYWIRGYLYSAKPYIEARQIGEPSQWENIVALYRLTSKVEIWKTFARDRRLRLDDGEVAEFLDEEIGLKDTIANRRLVLGDGAEPSGESQS